MEFFPITPGLDENTIMQYLSYLQYTNNIYHNYHRQYSIDLLAFLDAVQSHLAPYGYYCTKWSQMRTATSTNRGPFVQECHSPPKFPMLADEFSVEEEQRTGQSMTRLPGLWYSHQISLVCKYSMATRILFYRKYSEIKK